VGQLIKSEGLVDLSKVIATPIGIITGANLRRNAEQALKRQKEQSEHDP
jgi:hypothetical protein